MTVIIGRTVWIRERERDLILLGALPNESASATGKLFIEVVIQKSTQCYRFHQEDAQLLGQKF